MRFLNSTAGGRIRGISSNFMGYPKLFPTFSIITAAAGGPGGPGMRSGGPTVGPGGARARARGGQGWGQGGARAGARGGQGWGQGGPWPPWPPRWLRACSSSYPTGQPSQNGKFCSFCTYIFKIL